MAECSMRLDCSNLLEESKVELVRRSSGLSERRWGLKRWSCSMRFAEGKRMSSLMRESN